MSGVFQIPGGNSAETSAVICAEDTTASNAFSSIGGVQAPPPPIVPDPEGAFTSAMFTISPDEKWSKAKERRFSDLVALKSLDRADDAQLMELHSLQQLRRHKKNPLSADEVLFQYQRRQFESRLLKQLHEYVDFLNAPTRNSKTQA